MNITKLSSLQVFGIGMVFAILAVSLPFLLPGIPMLNSIISAASGGRMTRPIITTVNMGCVGPTPQVVLNWTKTEATSYTLSRERPSKPNRWPQIGSGLLATTYLDSNFAIPGKYRYQVMGSSYMKQNAFSDIVEVVIPSCPIAVAIPEQFVLATSTSTTTQGETISSTTQMTSAPTTTNESTAPPAPTPSPSPTLTVPPQTVASTSSEATAVSVRATTSAPSSPVAPTTSSAVATEGTTQTIIQVTNKPSLNFPTKEWGAYVGWQENEMQSFESQVGADAKHRAVFIHWGTDSAFPMYLGTFVRDRGETLTIFWEATDYRYTTPNQPKFAYDAVLRGDFDAYINKFVADAKAYNGPVVLVPFSEMNGNWNPSSGTQNGNSPEKHIAAYRYVRNFFRSTPNVQFGWAPNHESVPNTPDNAIGKYYPGDDYVDIIGVDGFNFGSPWKSFDELFGDALSLLTTYNKPIFVLSFASASGIQKAGWITDALTVQIPKYPAIKGWIWFNESKEKDWRVWSDASSLAAFKEAVK